MGIFICGPWYIEEGYKRLEETRQAGCNGSAGDASEVPGLCHEPLAAKVDAVDLGTTVKSLCQEQSENQVANQEEPGSGLKGYVPFQSNGMLDRRGTADISNERQYVFNFIYDAKRHRRPS